MEGYMRVQPANAAQRRKHQSKKCRYWLVAERREQQVEPNHVRSEVLNSAENAGGIVERVRFPTANHIEVGQFDRAPIEFVSDHGHAEQRILLQLSRDVISILTESPLTWGER